MNLCYTEVYMAKLLYPVLVAFRADAKTLRAWRACAKRADKSFSAWVRDTLNLAVR